MMKRDLIMKALQAVTDSYVEGNSALQQFAEQIELVRQTADQDPCVLRDFGVSPSAWQKSAC